MKTKKKKSKFLFYYMKKAVYENDETHKELERIRNEGGAEVAAKKEIENIKKFFDNK